MLLFIEMLPILIKRVAKFKIIFCLLVLCWFTYLASTSLSPINSYLGVLRLFEVLFVTWCVSYFFSFKKSAVAAPILVSLSLIIVGILAIWQFVMQQSIGGLWYYLGERSFTSLTPGIANANLHGSLVLRPYASFPHPNVLAAYGVIMLTYLLFIPYKLKGNLARCLLVAAGVMGFLIIMLSMSRTGIGVMFVVLFIWLLRLIKKNPKALFVVLLVLVLSGVLLNETSAYLRFTTLSFSDEAVIIREFLIAKALGIISTHPLTGVGLQNFLPSLAQLTPVLTPLSYFQPVHSVYLLIATETGLVGLLLFVSLLVYSAFKIFSTKQKLVKLMLLVVFLLLSLTDHYFYTLHQGQLLTAFVFGVILSDLPSLFTHQEAKILRKTTRSRNHTKSLSDQPLKIPRTGTSSKVKTSPHKRRKKTR